MNKEKDLEEQIFEARKKQAELLLRHLSGERVTEPTFVRYSAILNIVRRAQDALKLYEPDADASPVVWKMIKSIEAFLGESEIACLRNFFFQVPSKQERAFAEIAARVRVIEWFLDQLKQSKGSPKPSGCRFRAWGYTHARI